MSLVLEVCQYLRERPELDGVYVSNRMPNPARTPAVIVGSSGGFAVNAAVDSWTIDVRSYAVEDLDADELAATLRRVLDGMNTASIHDCWPVMLPVDSVDSTSGLPIRFARYGVLLTS